MKLFSRWRHLIWILLPILLWWVLKSVPFDEVWAILARLTPWQVAAWFGLNMVILLLFSIRSRLILLAQGFRLPYVWLSAYRLLGFAVSYFTPGSQFGGEPLQIYWLQRRHRVPGSVALTTVALDKLFEVLASFVFLVFGLVFVLRSGLLPTGLSASGRTAAWLAGLVLLPGFYLLAIWIGKRPLGWLLQRLPVRWQRKPRLAALGDSVREAEGSAARLLRGNPALTIGLAAASGLIWLFAIGEYWVMIRLMGVSLTLPQTILALTLTRLAFLTPLPGGLGALEASQMLAMQALGLNPALGISVSLLIRARDVTIGLIGIVIGISLSRGSSRSAVPIEAGD